MSSIITHYEKYLGEILHGWRSGPDGGETAFDVVQFKGGPIAGTSTFATVGLSKFKLASRASAKVIRQELLIMAKTSYGTRSIPGLLQQVGGEMIARCAAYLRGEVISPRGRLFKGCNFEALYVTMPTYFPDPFASFEVEIGETGVVAWLVPIARTEAEYVQLLGWDRFEDLLEQRDPDLLDFGRKSLV